MVATIQSQVYPSVYPTVYPSVVDLEKASLNSFVKLALVTLPRVATQVVAAHQSNLGLHMEILTVSFVAWIHP